MTLNLMLTSQEAVYLSGDFRLVSVEQQAPLPDSYNTQKLIPVIRGDWSALIAYMGIQSAPPLIGDMGQWILEQVDRIPSRASFSELSTRLMQLNRWLPRITGDRRVAVSAVGFQSRRPFMLLLSNFVDLDGHVTSAGSQLRAYFRTPNTAEVRAVGTARPDVFERVRLVRMLQAKAARGMVPPLIRQMMAETNASVARRSGESISEACVSGFLLRSGAVAIGSHGMPGDAACFPKWLQRDLEKGGVSRFEPEASSEGESRIQWRGTTARRDRTTIVRTHEIANAGTPVVETGMTTGRLVRWTSSRTGGRNTIFITFTDAPETDNDRPASMARSQQ